MRKLIDEQNQYIQQYIDGIIKYIEFVKNAPFVINSDNATFIITTGFKAITHIYHMNYIHTHDVETSHYSMQKAYLYYLEYLEQVSNSNMTKDLNHTDAIMFVYSKSLVNYSSDKINKKTDSDKNSIVDNMASISKIIEIILWWDNNTINRTTLCSKLLHNICSLSVNLNDDLLCAYIECGQKRTMDNDEYVEFLTYSVKLFREKIKTDSILSVDQWILNSIWTNNDTINEMTIKKWCRTIMN